MVSCCCRFFKKKMRKFSREWALSSNGTETDAKDFRSRSRLSIPNGSENFKHLLEASSRTSSLPLMSKSF
jgi:hypothetical protein